MRPDVSRWFARRSHPHPGPSAGELAGRKGSATVSLVLPALNEAATIGRIVTTVVTELVVATGLVDEVVVIDPGSRDATARIAAEAGAVVVAEEEVLPGYGRRPGKGEALWKSLFVTRGDLVVFCDADVTDFQVQFVTGLLAPLLADADIDLVKGCYDRPLLRSDGTLSATGGGRVSELLARPVLDLLWPSLAGFISPLSGEYAARRSLLERLPFASGYAVELGLLIDAVELVGLESLAQADLGRRSHRHQDDAALGRMAASILGAALERAGLQPRGGALVQFDRGTDGQFTPHVSSVAGGWRPPMVGIAEYQARRAQAS